MVCKSALSLSNLAAPLIPKGCGDANASVMDKALEAGIALLARTDEQVAARCVATRSSCLRLGPLTSPRCFAGMPRS